MWLVAIDLADRILRTLLSHPQKYIYSQILVMYSISRNTYSQYFQRDDD